MTDPTTLHAGWSFLGGQARKAHYFPEGEARALCGKWMRWRPLPDLDPESGEASPDDCAACRRKLDATR